MSTDVRTDVLRHLTAEGDRLEALVATLADEGWRTPTSAVGWDVTTQVAHLASTDEAALAAATDLARWHAIALEATVDPTGYVDRQALLAAQDPDLGARWSRSRHKLSAALAAYPREKKIPWSGPPMSPTSMATARLMETWAHSLDVHEALGAPFSDTGALGHIARLAVRTRNFAFNLHGLQPPTEDFRVELSAPWGQVWTFGPEDAAQRVTGSAGDFCRLATQRVHRVDTDLVAVGPDAALWLRIAQCFAGPPGPGRPPR